MSGLWDVETCRGIVWIVGILWSDIYMAPGEICIGRIE